MYNPVKMGTRNAGEIHPKPDIELFLSHDKTGLLWVIYILLWVVKK